jgi:signal transduction histidine kinase/CheY-like chemotaxis protein
LATVADRLLRSESPQKIIEDLCQLVLAHLDCQFFFNYLVEKPDHSLRLNAYAGITSQEAAAIEMLEYEKSVCGCVARDAKQIVVEKIQSSDDPLLYLPKRFGITAYCCFPLIYKKTLLGTLSFGTNERQSFAEDEIALMKSVVDQVAVAMQRLETEIKLLDLNQTLMEQVGERTQLAENRTRQLQALAVDLIEAEEKERQRIALILHDDLQQLLASANMQLNAACEIIPTDMQGISKVQRLLSDSIKKARTLSHELCPPILTHAGVVAAIKWLINTMDDQFGLNIKLNADDDIDFFDNKPLKLLIFRAIQELLFNIVKHSEDSNARIDLRKNNNKVIICVSDRGKGFDPVVLSQTEQQPGLGLASLRERVNHMGGTFLIESAPGKGCRFTLSLPLTATAVDIPATTTIRTQITIPVEKSNGEQIKIVIADDHKVMRQGLTQLLSNQSNIQVIGEACNGHHALELARQLNPDLILMDVSMPELDGIEATRRVKDELPHIQIIGLSMFEDEHTAMAMRSSGAEAYISKAASTKDIIEAIYNAVDRKKYPES